MRPAPKLQTRFNPPPDTWLVVPCYNEEKRLDRNAFAQFAASRPWLGLLFVNDGSSDQTESILTELSTQIGDQAGILSLGRNQGKAEAVRRGVDLAISQRAQFVGYWDADLATPLDAVDDFRHKLRMRPELTAVIGTRMPLMGHSIDRHPIRAWIGRCFARVASLAMNFRVWDTQCGAKLFRGSTSVQSAFATRFRSSWIFDVEVLARLRQVLSSESPSRRLNESIFEIPLDRWIEVPGSKVKSRDFVTAAVELLNLVRHYRLSRWKATSIQDMGQSPSELDGDRQQGGLLGIPVEPAEDQESRRAA